MSVPPGTPGRWRRASAAGTWRTESTEARAACDIRRRVYVDSASIYRRDPSAYSTPIAREDFPDPDTPATATSRSRGTSTSTSFRLWTRAPRICTADGAGRAARAGIGSAMRRGPSLAVMPEETRPSCVPRYSRTVRDTLGTFCTAAKMPSAKHCSCWCSGSTGQQMASREQSEGVRVIDGVVNGVRAAPANAILRSGGGICWAIPA